MNPISCTLTDCNLASVWRPRVSKRERSPTVRLGLSKEIPLTSLTEAVQLTIKTQEAATRNHLTQTGAVADLIRAELPPERVYEAGKRHVANYDSGAGSCSAS